MPRPYCKAQAPSRDARLFLFYHPSSLDRHPGWETDNPRTLLG